ncbi:MAG: CDP-alcohol phosphatidyltransferase family protein [bacterium]
MNLANSLSMARILLVPCFFWLCYYSYSEIGDPRLLIWCRVVLIVILVSDSLDGFVARRRRQVTTLGSLLDPLADKLFVMASFILLSSVDELPAWLTIIVVSKDILIVIGWALVATILGRVESVPTKTSKWATVFQFAAITAAVFSISKTYPQVAYGVYVITGGLTAVSIGQYFLVGLRLLSAGNGTPEGQDGS